MKNLFYTLRCMLGMLNPSTKNLLTYLKIFNVSKRGRSLYVGWFNICWSYIHEFKRMLISNMCKGGVDIEFVYIDIKIYDIFIEPLSKEFFCTLTCILAMSNPSN